jgi:hypothetical protein
MSLREGVDTWVKIKYISIFLTLGAHNFAHNLIRIKIVVIKY